MVNIFTINSILVNIAIISGSYVNGSTQPTIYSFFPNVSPGYKIIENPHRLLYLPITPDTIHSITIWITDQNGNELNLPRTEFVNAISSKRDFKNILSLKKMTSYTNVKVLISKCQKTSSRKHFNQIASLSRLSIWTVKTLLSSQNHNLVD